MSESTIIQNIRDLSGDDTSVEIFQEILSLEDYINFTSKWEGFDEKAYLDTSNGCSQDGYKSSSDEKRCWTIGYGTNIDKSKGYDSKLDPFGMDYGETIRGEILIKEEDAMTLMSEHIQKELNFVSNRFSNFESFPKEAKLILVDMTYNLGQIKFIGFEDMNAELRKNPVNWTLVASHAQNSNWYAQVGQRSENHVSTFETIVV